LTARAAASSSDFGFQAHKNKRYDHECVKRFETKCFLRRARFSHKAVNQNECASKRTITRELSSAIETEGFRRRGSDAFRREPLLGRRSLVRRQIPACSRAVENLDSPQHNDDGRYQRGRHQYTF
jgi:hypothetical protein